jgi:putative ATPase
MINGGEDPRYIARRLVRFAAEDIGMADPNALTQALAGWETYERLGSPEGELAIAQVVIYLGTAPKSNAIYTAFGQAKAVAKATGSLILTRMARRSPRSRSRHRATCGRWGSASTRGTPAKTGRLGPDH